jgi:hypothetical protein
MFQRTKLGMVTKSVGEAFIVNVEMMELRVIISVIFLINFLIR